MSYKKSKDTGLQMPESCFDHRAFANGGGASTPIYILTNIFSTYTNTGISANLRTYSVNRCALDKEGNGIQSPDEAAQLPLIGGFV